MNFSMIVLIVLLALVAMFAIQNPGIITVKFLHLSGATSLLVVIVASFAAGVLGGWLAGLPRSFRRRSETSAARKRVEELEAEVAALKAKSAAPKAPGQGGGR